MQHLARALRILGWLALTLYAAAALFSLAILVEPLGRLVGVEPDALNGVPAIFLSLPWSLVLGVVAGGEAVALIVIGAGLALNTAIGVLLLRWLGRDRSER